MLTLPSVMQTLQAKGSEKIRATYARHGMSLDRTIGVSVADLKLVAKQIKGRQELALALYDTGLMEAMYLAGMVADGRKMTREHLQHWAEDSGGMQMISEYTVPWVAVENPYGHDLANRWIGAAEEHVATAGWCTHSGLVATKADTALDLTELDQLMQQVVKEIAAAQNRVKYTMNNFVISVGTYVQPLRANAKAIADKLGTVTVDVGDTACKVPVAADYLLKSETRGPAKKRRTIRC